MNGMAASPLRSKTLILMMSLLVVLTSSFSATSRASSMFDDLALAPAPAATRPARAVDESPADDDDPTFPVETGARLTVTGTLRRAGTRTFVQDSRSGETFELVGFGAPPTDSAAPAFSGVVAMAFDDEGEGAAPRLQLVAEKAANVFTEGLRFDLRAVARFLERLSPIGAAHADEDPHFDIVFPREVLAEGTRFLRLYADYRTKAFAFLATQYKKSHGTATPSQVAFSTINSLNKQAHGAYRTEYDRAIAACNDYIAACTRARLWRSVDSTKTYMHFDKRTALLRVVDPSTNETLLCVPFAYGGNPDGGTKRRNGDYRTPDTGSDVATVAKTPFYVGRRVPHTAASGMTTRCMGVSSTRPADKYWVTHGMNIAIHGTPDKWSMGLRASHGCLRVIDDHVIRVYDLTSTGTKIVIRGLE